MRPIVTIDRQPTTDTVAVWVTHREGLDARHTNAVVIDLATDPDAVRKVHSLTRGSIVLATDGTTLDGLPVADAPLTVDAIGNLLAEVEELQKTVSLAVTDYRERTRSSSLVELVFLSLPMVDKFRPSADEAPLRALATANYVRSASSAWLRTDEERRRRTVKPKTGISPWIMPESLCAPEVRDFPERFEARLHEQGRT